MATLIYSVEDDESIRELIAYTLTNAGYKVSSFVTAEEMLSGLEKQFPELIVLDIMLPGISGIEALKIIREKYKNANIKVVMLTAKNTEFNKIHGLDMGADDYITKPFSVLELIARVKAHLRTTKPFKSGIATYGGLTVNTATRIAKSKDKEINLTWTEFELLLALISKAGTIVTREELLNGIWGCDNYGESRTVDIHMKNLRAKLGLNGSCIVNVRGVGYTLKELK